MDYRKLLFSCVLAFTLAVQAFVLFFNGWNAWTHMDDVLHIGWGAVIFLFLVAFRRWRPIDALLAVLCFQFLWEAGEITTDLLHLKPFNPYPNNFFFDGFFDTLNDCAGAAACWLLIKPCGDYPYRTLGRLHPWMTWFAVSMLPAVVLGSVLKLVRGASPDVFMLVWTVLALIASGVFTRKFSLRTTASQPKP